MSQLNQIGAKIWFLVMEKVSYYVLEKTARRFHYKTSCFKQKTSNIFFVKIYIYESVLVKDQRF